MNYDVWALMPDASRNGQGWTCLANELPYDQAAVYEQTMNFPVRVMPSNTGSDAR